MNENQKFTFLCGRVMSDSTGLLNLGIIRLGSLDSDGKIIEMRVSPNDPGLMKIFPGKKRMIIAKEGKIVAVFGRPRIKLLRMMECGVEITQDLIDCFSPMYPKPEKVFRTTSKWKSGPEYYYRTHSIHSFIDERFYR